jgi:hypothetical protein
MTLRRFDRLIILVIVYGTDFGGLFLMYNLEGNAGL